jgi:hypothetical protein
VPQVLARVDRSRGQLAARFLGSRFALARTLAASRGAAIGLRFVEEPGGVSFAVYQDGNRNGVLTADILRSVDRQIEPPTRLFELFPGVQIGMAAGATGSDPVQIGRSSILTFTPQGTATSGTIYLRGRDGTQWSVRVLGVTGRTRVLKLDVRTGDWVDAL